MFKRSLIPLQKAEKALKRVFLKPIANTKQQAQQRRKLRSWVWIVVIVGAAVVIGRFLFFKVEGNPFQWPLKARDVTGFGESYEKNVLTVEETGTEKQIGSEKTGNKQTIKTTTTNRLQPSKTLWDWMGLLLAPATLAILGFLFQSSQERAKRDKEEADKKRDMDQQREQALQAYFDQLSTLLVDKQLLEKLPDSEKNNGNAEAKVASNQAGPKIDVAAPEIDARAALNVVKAKTLALFRLFDNADPTDMLRKSSVLAFLGDTGLLTPLALDLSDSYWEKANLRRANLSGVNFSRANLSGANFSTAILSSANLSRANLSGANFSTAILIRANLNGANLSNADLSSAYLSRANLSRANLSFADLSFAQINNADLSRANLSRANLSNAGLNGANLSNADLSSANLSRANLSNADLSSAILLGVDLRTAKSLAKQHLEGEQQPLLCKVKLPRKIKVDPNRDCKELPEILQNRYPKTFNDLAIAQAYMDEIPEP